MMKIQLQPGAPLQAKVPLQAEVPLQADTPLQADAPLQAKVSLQAEALLRPWLPPGCISGGVQVESRLIAGLHSVFWLKLQL